MSQSPEHASRWWPEERMKATLNAKYIVNRLQPENIPRLFELPDWGEGLTSETYMDWILLKAARVFLILDTIGIPDRIFALINDSCVDNDLPVAENNVDQLHLSPDGKDVKLDTRFFHAQWRFLVRGIDEGDHVVYSEDEGVPIEVVRSNIGGGIHSRDEIFNKVVLAGSECRVYMRTQVQINSAPHFLSSNEILAEIHELRKLSHKHVVSIYGSYLQENSMYILFTGANAERTLHNFLADEPGSFKRLSKEQRRQILINWPHCLASAVSWLHAHGQAHGAIRPSNIFVDADFHIRLGQFQALESLLVPPHIDGVEAYNYSAPECQTRTTPTTAPVMPQKPQPVQTIQASGGRTKRRQKPAPLALSSLNENSSPSMDHARPDSTFSKGKIIRIGLPGSPSRFSIAFSTSSSSTASTSSSLASPIAHTNTKHRIPAFWSRHKPPSITSSSSSHTSSSTSSMPPSPSSLYPQSPLSPTTSSLRHSKSANSLASSSLRPLSQFISNPSSNPPSHSSKQNSPASPADLFSLAAVTLDILTSLHKRTQHSFVSHRSARNRSAGRGGGIADASFHLPRNAVQVQSWIALLEGDALKRCRRDRRSDAAFWAVPRMLIAVRAMLHCEPRKRPLARRVGRCFAAAVEGVGGKSGLVLHCARGGGLGVEKVPARKEVAEAVEMNGGSSGCFSSSVTPPDSVSEFEFGLDASGGESQDEDTDETPEEIEIEEPNESEYASEPEILVQQDSPQLYLPELDVSIKGVEELTLHGSDIS